MGEFKALGEMKVMERCRRHRHIVEYVASYRYHNAFNVIMTTLADQNPESLLENEGDDK
jgi:hypothetical protein